MNIVIYFLDMYRHRIFCGIVVGAENFQSAKTSASAPHTKGELTGNWGTYRDNGPRRR